MKNPLTPAGIEPATFRFVAQHLNHCATAVPPSTKGIGSFYPLKTSGLGADQPHLAPRLKKEYNYTSDPPLYYWHNKGRTLPLRNLMCESVIIDLINDSIEGCSAPVYTGPGAQPSSHTMGTGSFPGVKRPGCAVDHPLPSSAEVKIRVELYHYSPSGPSWPVIC